MEENFSLVALPDPQDGDRNILNHHPEIVDIDLSIVCLSVNKEDDSTIRVMMQHIIYQLELFYPNSLHPFYVPRYPDRHGCNGLI